MQIKLPLAKIAQLIVKLVKASKGGITKEEAAELGLELLDLVVALLGEEIVIPLIKK